MSYHSEKDYENIQKIEALLLLLPPFVRQFDTSLSNRNLSTRTRLNYMYDLNLFFEYLTGLETFKGRKPVQFDMQDLDLVSRSDVENYLKQFDISHRDHANSANKSDKLKARRLASLRSFYNYFCRGGDIQTNPASITASPKLHKKEIVSLSPEEVSRLLLCAQTGQGLSDHQRQLTAKTRLRDTAILVTLLGTGMRVSECVGIDMKDVNFYEACFRVIRKGGDEDLVFFGPEVEDAVQSYLEHERKLLKPDTSALFVSTTHGRLTDRAIQNLVKKYADAAGIVKPITPHKCRSTFATNLYNETNDVYMIKDALHHKSLETSKHYVNGALERKKRAARVASTLFES